MRCWGVKLLLALAWCLACYGASGASNEALQTEHTQAAALLQQLQAKMHKRVATALRPWEGRRISVQDVRTTAREVKLTVLAAVIDYKLYMPNMDRPKEKWIGWYAQLSDVLDWLRRNRIPLVNSVFPVRIVSAPAASTWIPSPVLGLASSPMHLDVPMPNPYFERASVWAKRFAQLQRLAAANPFSDRKPLAFYRGGCKGYPASLPRAQLTAVHDPALDVALTMPCWPWDNAPKHHRELTEHVRLGNFTALSSHAQHKYVVNMPGAITGSYSRNFQFMLGLGGVVLQWESPFFEFFYDWLEEDKHYVVVNATSIVDKIHYLNANPEVAENLAQNANRWFREHLHPNFLQQYWWELLTQYGNMLDFTPSIAHIRNPCTCASTFWDWRVSTCALCFANYSYDLGL